MKNSRTKSCLNAIAGPLVSLATTARFEEKIIPKLDEEIKPDRVNRKNKLKNIVSFHNDDGIKDIHQIKRMADAITSGEHILSREVHNIKLVKTWEEQLLLFDGHHSILAYIITGRTYLEEIPHLMVIDKANGYLNDQDISVFYGEHA